MIIYDGPSKIDGKPIIVILIAKSKNVKTGDMAQTYILRKDMNPIESIKTGNDKSICGSCVHKGTSDGTTVKGRSCYVTVFQGPFSVYSSYKKGNYPKYNDEKCKELLKGKTLRIGTYGDPAAVPVHIWEKLIGYTSGHTSYTHRWNHSKVINSRFKKFSMASCDTAEEAIEALAKGWRYFRVRTKDSPVMSNEIMCPASEEMGKISTCTKCRLCSGADKKAKSITIIAHGSPVTKVVATRNLIQLGIKGK